MTFHETLKEKWIYIAFVIIVIIPLMYVIVSFVMMVNEPSYALVLEELNDSEVIQFTGYFTENGSIIQTSNVINLTEEDFRLFPKLAPIIRDKDQKALYVNRQDRQVYHVNIWDDEYSAFVSQIGSSGYLGYNGKRYHFAFMHVD
jgi:hypothetical protein